MVFLNYKTRLDRFEEMLKNNNLYTSATKYSGGIVGLYNDYKNDTISDERLRIFLKVVKYE